ncbi:MAG TPA: TonB family protein [Steroidobacteraceae bacterium]|jgi:TonB family protein
MMLLSQDRIQRSSDGAAMVLSAGILALLFIAKAHSSRDVALPPPGMSQSSIEVSLQTQPVVTPPTPPAPPPKVLPHHVVPQRVRAAEIPVPAAPPPANSEAAPVPEGAALVASAASTAPAAYARPDLEAEYAAGLRADIDHRTRPPDSAQYRLHHPSGEVRIGFVVMRSGETKAIRLLRSSGSALLDETAQTIVAAGHYPPIPVEAFAGEPEHLFAVTIEFRPAS